MKPDELSIPVKDLHRPRLTTRSGPNLPEENRFELLGLAISAGWTTRMLDTPVYSARKCPILPGFIPKAIGHGLAVVRDEDDILASLSPRLQKSPHASQSSTSPRLGFHGELITDEHATCPYRETP